MEHRTRTESIAAIVARLAMVIAVAIAVLVIAPARSHALALVAPADGAQLEWMQTRPVVAFDVTQGEKPKWALLATDAAMTKTLQDHVKATVAPYKYPRAIPTRSIARR